MEKTSVLMAVYQKDKPEFVANAIESITSKQTVPPDEILIIVDGPIPDDLKSVIVKYQTSKEYNFTVIWLPKNNGLGNALRIGVEKATYNIIVRMDSDDIAMADRISKQLKYLEANPHCDIVGGQISEFIDNESNMLGHRIVPCKNEDIYSWMKKRCPFNHMTVMFKKSKILNVGNYIDWHFNEDYYLWIRMAEAGYVFANLPDTLVNVRVGKEMYARRGGWRYFKSEKGLQDYMLKRDFISLPQYIYNILGRFVVQVAMPNRLRGFIFQKLFRK